MKKILIPGISGLLGSYLEAAAKRRGYSVVGTSRAPPKGSCAFAANTVHDMERVIDIVRPDFVIFCSAWTHVDECESHPEACLNVNSLTPSLVCAAAQQRGARFVLISSSYVFDGTRPVWREGDSPNPLNWYGTSKSLAERLVFFHTDGCGLVIRTMGVYGLVDGGKDFCSQIVRAVSNGIKIRVANDQFGNFTFAGDLAENILSLIERGARGIWHVAGPNPLLCRHEIAKEICVLGHWDPQLVEAVSTTELKQWALRPKYGGLDISKINAEGLVMHQLKEVWNKTNPRKPHG